MNNKHHSNDSSNLDHWTCAICFKIISPNRPPNRNADNCSCAEKAKFASSLAVPNTTSSYNQTSTLQPSALQYPITNVPESNTSSNPVNDIDQHPADLAIPQPNLPLPLNSSKDTFLPLAPSPGFNERQARLSSSYPFQLQRFLNSPEYFSYSHTSAIEDDDFDYHDPANSFLEQGVCFESLSMVPQDRSSKRSKLSGKLSSGSGGGREEWYNGLRSVGALVVGMGGWVDGDGDFYEGGDQYPAGLGEEIW